MNRQKFLAELSRLLGFMSSWDREAEMNKYTEMLDAAEDEAALIESLGTPTQIAISVARDYKPTPRPGTQPPEPPPSPEPAPVQSEAGEERAAVKPEPEEKPEPEPEPAPPPPPPKKKRDETQIVTGGEFEYGMELAILMGEPISAAVESALNGEYLPDPDFSLEEILREARGETEADLLLSESAETPAGDAQEEAAEEPPAEAEPAAEDAGESEEDTAAPEPEQEPAEAEADAAGPEATQESAPEQPVPAEPEPTVEAEAEKVQEPAAESVPEAETAEAAPGADKPEAVAEDGESGTETEGGAPAGDRKPEGEGDGKEKPEKPGAEAGPVFDASTAPLPEAVKGADDAAGETGQSADVPETQAKHPPHLVFDPEKFAPLPPDEPVEEPEEETEQPRRAVSPAGTAVYVIFALIIGIPMALLLALIGVPVLLLGLGLMAGTVYAGTGIITALDMFSDILLVAGTGLAICALGLLLAWLGLWLSIELGSLWINAVLLRLGRALCLKREADVE